MNKIFNKFGKKRVFLPVIHPAFGMSGLMKSVEDSMYAEADGVFLINQGMSVELVVRAAEEVKKNYEGLWLGANFLGFSPSELKQFTKLGLFDGIWSDDCGVDSFKWNTGYSGSVYQFDHDGWDGLYFGGTAFKTQAPIPNESLSGVARNAASKADIVTTSGRATGVAADITKIQIMKEAIGEHSLGLASGVTTENIKDYLPYVDAYLVASGIEKEFGVFDLDKMIELSEKIHGM